MALRPRKKVKYSEDDSSFSDESKTTAERRVRGRRGILKDLPSMPLDIIDEVFSQLLPLDLLHLAQTTKEFRAFLMTRGASRYWKVARRNVEGLPECPEDLSEPEYANLAFSNRCNNCLKLCQKVRWSIGQRLCAKCTRDYDSTDRPYDRFYGVMLGLTWPCDVSLHVALSFAFKGFEELHVIKRRKCRIELPEITAFKDKWIGLSQEAHLQFLKLVRDKQATDEKHARLCDIWYTSYKAARSDHLNASRKSRRKSIYEKLETLGWGDEFDKMSHVRLVRFTRLPEVKQPTVLTDRIWKRIEPQMVAYMEESKAERLLELQRPCLADRFELLKKVVLNMHRADEVFPFALDFALSLTEVRQIIDVPHDVKVTEEDLMTLLPVVPKFLEDWKRKGASHFSELVKRDVPVPDGIDPLSLAVATIFKCDCRIMKTYPDVLLHRCGLYWSYGKCEDQYTEAASNLLQYGSQSWARCKAVAGDIKNIIEACGEDPLQVTASHMDSVDARVTCLPCNKPGLQRIMTWRAAVDHKCNPDFSHYQEAKWEKVSEAHCIAVKDLEVTSKGLVRAAYESSSVFACAHCPRSDLNKGHVSLSTLKRHLLESHEIPEPSNEKDYVRHAGGPSMICRPVFLISPDYNGDVYYENMSGYLARGEAKVYDI